ncbi:MAG: hypothetical protein R3D00_28220 [Bacteroidia bacterium]
MAKLDSIIKKKVLDARPPIKGANWQEMEAMLSGAQSRKRRGGWLFFADAGLILLLVWVIFCEVNIPGIPHDHHDHSTAALPPETVAPELTPPAEVNYSQPVSASKNNGAVISISRRISLHSPEDSIAKEISADITPDFVVAPHKQDDGKASLAKRDSAAVSGLPLQHIRLIPGGEISRKVFFKHQPLKPSAYALADPLQPRWMRSRWALEVHLNNVHAPVYWGKDSVKRFFSNYNNPGIGISFLRRRSNRYTWGLRLDLDVPSYPVDTSPDDPFAYSRMWGGGWDLGFFMRQYMNDDLAKRFRPYWQAGLGYNVMGMNAYNISRIDNPYDDPKTQWILRKSRLEEESINFYPFETYIHMTSSGGIGAELRIYRRVSFTMCSVLYANMLINKDRLNNPDQYWGYNYYLKHSFGLQYGF